MRNAVRLVMWALCGMFLAVTSGVAEDGVAGPFDLGIELGAEWTDNRDATPVENDNIDLFVRGTIKTIVERDRTLFELFYAPMLRYRDDPAPLQNDEDVQHDLGIRLIHNPSPRVKISLFEDFNYTDDPAVNQGGSTLRRDDSFVLNRARAAVSADVGRQSKLSGSVSHLLKRYDESAVAAVADEENVEGVVGLGRHLDRTLLAVVEGRVMTHDYGDEGARDTGFSSVTAGAGFDKMVSTKTKATVRAGWTQLEFDDSELRDEDSLYANVGLELTPDPATRIMAKVFYGLRDSDIYPFSSQEYGDVTASIRHQASEKVQLGLSGAYRLGDYDADSIPTSLLSTVAGLGTGETSGEETTIIIEGEAKYKLSENTAIKIVQRFEDVDSELEALRPSFTRNATRVVLSQSF